jgi:hypothetical protein
MEKSCTKLQVTFNGNHVLLPLCLALLACSTLLLLSVLFHWPKFFRAFGVIGLLFSPAILMLSCWEVWRYQHRWRSVLAAFVSLLATLIGWAAVYYRVTGRL